MKAKKLHTDECYVCIISFIRSVWPWSWPWYHDLGLRLEGMRPWYWPWGHDLGLGHGHGLGLDSAGLVNITDAEWCFCILHNRRECFIFCILAVLLYLCDFASADCFNLAFVLQDFNKRILLEPLLRFDTSAAVGGRFDVGLWD